MICDAVTSFFGMLIEQAEKPIFALLGDTLLATPDVTGNPALVELWTTALGIAGAGYVLFVLVGGALVMGYETVQSRYALKQIAPRLVLGLVAAAASLTVLGKGIALANAASAAILDGAKISGEGIAQQLLGNPLLPAGNAIYELFLVLVLLTLVFAVLVGYTVRVALVAVLAACAPLALSCHALPVTDGIARLWWRAVAGCLVIQLAQSTVLVVGLKLYFTPGNTVLGLPNPSQLSNLLAGLCLFWVLVKLPGWTARVVFRSTPVSMPGLPLPVRMLRSVALAYVLRGAFRGGSRARLSQAGGSPRPGGGPPGPTTSGPPSRPGGGSPRPPGPHPAPPPSAAPSGGLAVPSPTPSSGASPTPPAAGASSPGVPHPAGARRKQQLALPIPADKVPGRRSRPVQTWLPITVTRQPRTPPQPAPPAGGPAPGVRGRQTVLPIPATRVRVRSPRPMQLRLPLDNNVSRRGRKGAPGV